MPSTTCNPDPKTTVTVSLTNSKELVSISIPEENDKKGAKRDPWKLPKRLNPGWDPLRTSSEELEYAEKTYEASLEADLRDSQTKLDELDNQYRKELGIQEPDESKDLRDSRDLPVRDYLGSHPNTVRDYTAVLLSIFSNLETEYKDPKGNIHWRKIPVFYAHREKLMMLDTQEFQNLTNGNTNIIPRASFAWDSMAYDSNRQLNRSLGVNKHTSFHTLAGNTAYAEAWKSPSPYNLSGRLTLITRGINEALMIAEQVASVFNPFYNMDISQANETQSIRVQLEGISFEPPMLDEYSQNEVITEFSFLVYGNLFGRPYRERLLSNIKLNIGEL